jgi:hypothetical protein
VNKKIVIHILYIKLHKQIDFLSVKCYDNGDMWDLRVAAPFGRISKRSILLFAAALLAASFVFAFLFSQNAHAADAKWDGATITYGQNKYSRVADAKDSDKSGLSPGTQVYAYFEPATSTSPIKSKVHLIYFAPGADIAKTTAATYATYDYTSPPDTYSNASGRTSITLDPQTAPAEKTTSCDSSFTFGIGWIICPITNFLSSAMDWLFGILSNFLTVRPVQTSQDNALFRAWSYMRNIANVAFVIGFLIIIYSQITQIGLSNYDIKKMLPRLVIAAILVNVSYWICAIAIDISNICGYSIQDVFISIRNSLVGAEGNSWSVASWKSVSGAILSGSTAALATGVGAYALVATAGTISGALYMLLPILVGVLVAVLVALVVMAARQAIITILVIVSPLAFVAYLLPNTEKYFEKWQTMGMTMLLVFPMFSVVFGGSQLAGVAIIQNADSINLIILGMAVQVAPVAITPFLMKFSGSLLQKIGGIVNNPGKGLIDRTRKFSEERRDQRKAQAFATPLNRKRDAFARASRNIDNKRRTREGWQKANEAMADANWANSSTSSDIQQQAMQAALRNDLGTSRAQARFEASKNISSTLQGLDIDARAAKLRLDLTKAQIDANWEEIKAGNGDRVIRPAGLAGSALASYVRGHVDQASEDAMEMEVASSRAAFGKHEQKQNYVNALLNSQELQTRAGGVSGVKGAESALASAVAAYRKEYDDNVQNKVQLIKHFKLSSDMKQDLALGKTVTAERDGNTYTFRAEDDYARDAAIETQMQQGSFEQIERIIKESGKTVTIVDKETGHSETRVGLTSGFASTIASAITKNKIGDKAIYLAARSINTIEQGKFEGDTGIDEAIKLNLISGKVKNEILAGMDATAIARMFKVSETIGHTITDSAERAAFNESAQALRYSAYEILDNPLLTGKATDAARKVLKSKATRPPGTP